MRTLQTEERLRESFQQGLDLLNGDRSASIGDWKDWLWVCHLAVKAHVAELNKREEAITAPLRTPDQPRIDIGI